MAGSPSFGITLFTHTIFERNVESLDKAAIVFFLVPCIFIPCLNTKITQKRKTTAILSVTTHPVVDKRDARNA
jgi:hypothetical protein